MSANPRSPESGDVPEMSQPLKNVVADARKWGATWPAGVYIVLLADRIDALTAELSTAREREKALSIRLANAELERDQIDRTLESAEVPDTLPDDPDETPLSRADRVEWLSDARDEAEHLLSTARERADRAEQDSKRLDFLGSNPIGLRALDGNCSQWHARPFDVRYTIDAAIEAAESSTESPHV